MKGRIKRSSSWTGRWYDRYDDLVMTLVPYFGNLAKVSISNLRC